MFVSNNSERLFRKITAVQDRQVWATLGLECSNGYSSRKQPRRIVVQNLTLRRGPNRQGMELFNVSLDCRDAGPGPVRTPQDFISHVFDSRKIFHQFPGWDSGNIHVHVLVPPHEEKRFVHPEWSATVRENDHEIWIVDAHVVTKHRLRMKISRAGENGSPRMNHDRHAVCLSTLVNRRKAAIAVHVIVGRKHLMRGMHLDGSNSKFCETIHFRARIRNRSWQHSAKRDKTIRRCAAILCTPVIHFRSETDNLWRDIVDQSRALHSKGVQKGEKGFR